MDNTKLDEKAIEKFWSCVNKSDGCWEWQKGLTVAGYGRFTISKADEKKVQAYAHRISYTLIKGEIPKGFVICHKCDNPKCVNPDHLFAGTHSDNTQDMVSKGRSGGFHRSTHCGNGHELTPENIGFDKQKNCKICLTCYKISRKGIDKRNNRKRRVHRIIGIIKSGKFILLPVDKVRCIDCNVLTGTTKWRKSRCVSCKNAHDRAYWNETREQSNGRSKKYKARVRAEKKALKPVLPLDSEMKRVRETGLVQVA